MERIYTPEKISELKENEVFVFGSNKGGFHNGGAAYFALVNFGAEYGNGEGLQGKSYALPTLDEDFKDLNEEEQTEHIVKFIQYASDNSDKTFYLTKIGCGIAAKPIDYIKRCFHNALNQCGFSIENYPQNLIIPKEFE